MFVWSCALSAGGHRIRFTRHPVEKAGHGEGETAPDAGGGVDGGIVSRAVAGAGADRDGNGGDRAAVVGVRGDVAGADRPATGRRRGGPGGSGAPNECGVLLGKGWRAEPGREPVPGRDRKSVV